METGPRADAEEAGVCLAHELWARRVGGPCVEGPVTLRGWSEAGTKLSGGS